MATVCEHLSVEELEARYVGCQDATASRHFQVIWLLARGHTLAGVGDVEAIAEAVQRPTMRFVATKSSEQLDLQALHRVRERLVSQRTGIINQ
jgi:transposase